MAQDAETGAMGVAVQSHWFSVGSVVGWGEAGVGAVATQSIPELSYGPLGLARLRVGENADKALRALVAADPQAAVRQVAIVDAQGGIAVHTGEECMAYAGHLIGEGHSCQANMMAGEGVWPAMSDAFSGASGPLAERLMDALDAGEAAGGDVRGRQSAAIVVVPSAGEPWERIVDLRVEDHPEPLIELRRLVGVHNAYVVAGEGDELVGKGDHVAAAEKYVRAYEMAPDYVELEFWAGLALVQVGERDRGLARVRAAIERDTGWLQLLERLEPSHSPAAAEARRLLGLA